MGKRSASRLAAVGEHVQKIKQFVQVTKIEIKVSARLFTGKTKKHID
jgi:hypothetical protein